MMMKRRCMALTFVNQSIYLFKVPSKLTPNFELSSIQTASNLYLPSSEMRQTTFMGLRQVQGSLPRNNISSSHRLQISVPRPRKTPCCRSRRSSSSAKNSNIFLFHQRRGTRRLIRMALPTIPCLILNVGLENILWINAISSLPFNET